GQSCLPMGGDSWGRGGPGLSAAADANPELPGPRKQQDYEGTEAHVGTVGTIPHVREDQDEIPGRGHQERLAPPENTVQAGPAAARPERQEQQGPGECG